MSFEDTSVVKASDYPTLQLARAMVAWMLTEGWVIAEVSEDIQADRAGGRDWMPLKTLFVRPDIQPSGNVIVQRQHHGTQDGARAVIAAMEALGWTLKANLTWLVPPRVELYKPDEA